MSQPRVLQTYQELELPAKTNIFGKVAKQVDSDSEEDEEEKKLKRPAKSRKVESQPKVSYDKSNEDCENIVHAKKKNGEIKSKSNQRVVDVSAWDELHVPESIKKTLSKMGFSSPTEIQVIIRFMGTFNIQLELIFCYLARLEQFWTSINI